ncbi:MAG: hypothetical protein JXR25_11535 [Pontiellaceae bacterium]|nr:hypothetical protein [Pontiellaceae bacterium]MBN2785446.1 hypothetical protein [Pontiellaceae bacterium]
MNRLTLCLLTLLCITSAHADPTSDFIQSAKIKYGAEGEKAAQFLTNNMPEKDRQQLNSAFLEENLDLALRARKSFAWAAQVPENLFLNDVLPYAVVDERRDRWRPDYFVMASNIVDGAASATEAVQQLNRDFFKVVNVHYNTKRERPNQSPIESAEQSMASCTGLSIILVDACRAIGIPARIAGTPLWTNMRGNHTWVEFWDGDWHFIGADEYDAAGVDRGWFAGDASKALADNPRHAIYATSWKKTEGHFPMVWAPEDTSVAGINVTSRYAAPAPAKDLLGIRLYSTNDRRAAVEGMLLSEDGDILARFTTRDENHDMNDMPELDVEPGKRYRIRFRNYLTEPFTAEAGLSTMDIHPQDLSQASATLTKDAIPEQIKRIYAELLQPSLAERKKELGNKQIVIGDNILKWKERTFGKAPKTGRSLWISMHGGGGTTADVNDQQWSNQVNLYELDEGICIAPRAPTDAWNMWHQAHIDVLFSRLIEDCIAVYGINPDKVYLMGYSAGGDGVWQLAPRMADRFAAAAMMAGHPNEASLLGLRNLPFAMFVGGEDSAYDRNKIVAERAAKMDELQKDDPDGYVHMSRIYKGLPHWMDRKDQEGIPWMAEYTRNIWPKKIVWFQDDVTHNRFYWLRLPDGSARQGDQIVAAIDGQRIDLTGKVPSGTCIRLSDELLNLDEPVTVYVNGKLVCERFVERSEDVIRRTLQEQMDPAAVASAEIKLAL